MKHYKQTLNQVKSFLFIISSLYFIFPNSNAQNNRHFLKVNSIVDIQKGDQNPIFLNLTESGSEWRFSDVSLSWLIDKGRISNEYQVRFWQRSRTFDIDQFDELLAEFSFHKSWLMFTDSLTKFRPKLGGSANPFYYSRKRSSELINRFDDIERTLGLRIDGIAKIEYYLNGSIILDLGFYLNVLNFGFEQLERTNLKISDDPIARSSTFFDLGGNAFLRLGVGIKL